MCVGRGKEHVSLDKKSECLAKAKFKRDKTCGCVEGQVGWKEMRMVIEMARPCCHGESTLGRPLPVGAEHKGEGGCWVVVATRGKEEGVCILRHQGASE